MRARNLVVPSSEGRHPPRHDFWTGKRKEMVLGIVMPFILLQLLFLCDMSYLFGSMFEESHRVYKLKVLMVNYDDGPIATSLQTAAESFKSAEFPTIIEHPVVDYPDVWSVVQAVRGGGYWGAIYTHAGASSSLVAALGGGEAAATYNASGAITYVWNEARYAATSESEIEANMEKLIAATSGIYQATDGRASLEKVNSSDPNALKALYEPIVSSNYNIKPTTQAVRVVYGALPMVFSILMQFFFLMAINGVSQHLQLYSHMSIPVNAVIRLLASLTHTFFGSLCFAGVIRAFKEDWNLTTAEFFCMWMIFWLDMHINFCVIDVATTLLPLHFFSFFVLTWVIINISSTLTPFELVPGFYRWSYALPAHEAFTVLIQIWSDGAINRLKIALPIMFAWELVGLFGAYIALNYRCIVTKKALEDEQQVKTMPDNDNDDAASTMTGVTLTLHAIGADAGVDNLVRREMSDRARILADRGRIQSQYAPYFPDTFMTLDQIGRGSSRLSAGERSLFRRGTSGTA